MLAIQKAIRRIHTSLDAPRLTRFTLQAPKNVEVEYANGSKFNLTAEFLRIHSPAVDGKVRSVGGEKVIIGRRHVGIMSAEPVGNYGVSNKFTLMRNYIKTLKKHGLSRDPPRRK
ncbi:hypothetical protein OIU77_016274 [Salix suchowensis]|uniref:Gamma-butyrobetaine hydroxylase-like N-terminal domain-containing protein n=1 Tax=Salix suchowensis TaxID=1278906 RepID=A0ABQ8ZJX2_9ROSI|nr:hypothetical protein OIU77_016274 [Salix suchowensis]